MTTLAVINEINEALTIGCKAVKVSKNDFDTMIGDGADVAAEFKDGIFYAIMSYVAPGQGNAAGSNYIKDFATVGGAQSVMGNSDVTDTIQSNVTKFNRYVKSIETALKHVKGLNMISSVMKIRTILGMCSRKNC